MNKKNGFDLLRLILSVGVLINHGIIIGGYNTLKDPLEYLSKGQTNLGEVSVMGFFTLSGYLISGSFINTRNMLIFSVHRLLRILPGFWVSLLVTSFIIAPIIFYLGQGSLSGYQFLGTDSAANFFLRNFFVDIRQWSIHAVLDKSAYKKALDGSLWSLYPELQCYCFVVLAGAMGLFSKNRALLLIVTVATLIFFAINFNFSKSFGPTILILSPALKLYASFISGSLVFTFKEQLLFDRKGSLFLFFFTLMLIKFGGFNILSPLLIAMCIINIFQLFEFRMKYDVSYGIYIYGFPIQHLLFMIFGANLPVALYLGLSVALSAILGFASFVAIERPFIRLRKTIDPVLIGIKNPLAIKF